MVSLNETVLKIGSECHEVKDLSMNIEELTEAVAGGATAFRVSARMQPVGGEGTPVYPATYGDDNGRTKYAVEGPIAPEGTPIKDVHEWKTALLQSVAQGARWMSAALEDVLLDGDLDMPNFEIDFLQYADTEAEADLSDLGIMSTLQVPHRVYDAILRDSLLDGTLFRLSDIGRAITEARPGNATALFQYAPTVLLFGGWDSTGPKGGLGSKFERALYSEIVAHDVRLGVKVGSRIDPLEIQKGAIDIYQAKDSDEVWVVDASMAELEKGKPKMKSKGGKPSEINHGNVTPSIDRMAGGIVMSHAVHTCVLSLGTLRKLRFATFPDGSAVPRDQQKQVNIAARTVLAALGLVAIAGRMESDFALRSRCHLINEEPWQIEMIGKHAEDVKPVKIDLDDALDLVVKAVENARTLGLDWHEYPIMLDPAEKLVELVRASRVKMYAEKVTEAGES